MTLLSDIGELGRAESLDDRRHLVSTAPARASHLIYHKTWAGSSFVFATASHMTSASDECCDYENPKHMGMSVASLENHAKSSSEPVRPLRVWHVGSTPPTVLASSQCLYE